MIYVDERVDELDIGASLAAVSQQRREQALKYYHESGQKLCIAAYLLLMEGLHYEYGIVEPPVFEYSANGKPFIASHPDIHFNLSHSANVALCALSSQPVGADVETPRQVSSSLIDYTMSDEEKAKINSSRNPALCFLSFWTKKEALLKLTAEGINNEMKDVLCRADNYIIETVITKSYVYSIAKYKYN